MTSRIKEHTVLHTIVFVVCVAFMTIPLPISSTYYHVFVRKSKDWIMNSMTPPGSKKAGATGISLASEKKSVTVKVCPMDKTDSRTRNWWCKLQHPRILIYLSIMKSFWSKSVMGVVVEFETDGQVKPTI